MNRIYTPVLLLASLLASCTSVPEEKPTEPASAIPTAKPATGHMSTACALPVYNFATIEAAHKRLSTIDVQRMLRQTPGLPSFFQNYSEYEDLFVLDTLHCQGYTLVPVLWRHEDCCEDMYYLTTSPNGSAVLDSVRIAGRGMDGQWQAEASMRLVANKELYVTTLEENDSDSDSEPNVLDSVITAFAVTPQGRFTKRQISSVQRHLRLGEHIPDSKE